MFSGSLFRTHHVLHITLRCGVTPLSRSSSPHSWFKLPYLSSFPSYLILKCIIIRRRISINTLCYIIFILNIWHLIFKIIHLYTFFKWLDSLSWCPSKPNILLLKWDRRNKMQLILTLYFPRRSSVRGLDQWRNNIIYRDSNLSVSLYQYSP